MQTQVPWLSVPDRPFPARAPRRRRRNRLLQSSSAAVELPAREPQQPEHGEGQREDTGIVPSAHVSSEPETPTTVDADSTQPTTPSSATQTATSRPQLQSRTHSKTSKPAVPLVPVVPIVPQGPITPRQPTKDGASRPSETPSSSISATPAATEEKKDDVSQPTAAPSADHAEESAKPLSPPRAAPKSWADLVRSKALSRSAGVPGAISAGSNDIMGPKSQSLADVLTSLGEDVTQYSDKVAFLEPRGLVNTGNMCYMNSVCGLSYPGSPKLTI